MPGPTVAQHKPYDPGVGTTNNTAVITLTSVVAGDTIAVCFGTGGSGSAGFTSVSDGTNTYALIAHRTDLSVDGYQVWWYVAKNVAAAASLTITATMTTSQAFNLMAAVEVGGADTVTPVDNSNFASDTTGTSATASVSVVCASTNDLLWACGIMDSGGETAGAGFALLDDLTQVALISESKAGVGSGSQTATVTGTAGNWLIGVLAFQAPQGSPIPFLRTNVRAPGFPPGAPLPGIPRLGSGILRAFFSSATQTITAPGIPPDETFSFPSFAIFAAPPGIPSGEQLSPAAIALTGSIPGISSSEQLSTSNVSPALTAPGIKSDETPSPTNVSLFTSPPGIPSSETLGLPAISQTGSVAGIPSGEQFSPPVVSPIITSPGIPTTEQLSTPAISQTGSPPGIPSSEVLGIGIIGAVITGAGIPSDETLSPPNVNLSSSPPGIPPAEQLSPPSVGVTITAPGISSAEQLSTSQVAPMLTAPGISSAETLSPPSISQTGSVTGIPSTESLSPATVSGAITAPGIPSAEQLSSLAGSQSANPPGIPTSEALSSSAVNLTATAPGIPASEQFSVPGFVSGILLSPPGIPSSEGFSAPALSLSIVPFGIPSAEQLSYPLVGGIPQFITAPGIPSDEYLGIVFGSVGPAPPPPVPPGPVIRLFGGSGGGGPSGGSGGGLTYFPRFPVWVTDELEEEADELGVDPDELEEPATDELHIRGTKQVLAPSVRGEGIPGPASRLRNAEAALEGAAGKTIDSAHKSEPALLGAPADRPNHTDELKGSGSSIGTDPVGAHIRSGALALGLLGVTVYGISRLLRDPSETHRRARQPEGNTAAPEPGSIVKKVFIRCGRPECRKCPHGPYWYCFWRTSDGVAKSRYLGKKKPR